MTNKEQKMRELIELLDELFTPATPKRPDNVKKGGSVK